ncbi:hypothetical protein ColTof4_07585 [Colletotrichum tofieldiae]|nr:hypothetical protein ColTof3_12538 [Colletotrichum tofieldiae]GKT75162.1 hypothetical protein ColTof4_07585 [Colletotrichum tofieldiae]GKT92402.1 hypothetical protein Ct61P_10252 [Colletotrichum tofieldiae]
MDEIQDPIIKSFKSGCAMQAALAAINVSVELRSESSDFQRLIHHGLLNFRANVLQENCFKSLKSKRFSHEY